VTSLGEVNQMKGKKWKYPNNLSSLSIKQTVYTYLCPSITLELSNQSRPNFAQTSAPTQGGSQQKIDPANLPPAPKQSTEE